MDLYYIRYYQSGLIFWLHLLHGSTTSCLKPAEIIWVIDGFWGSLKVLELAHQGFFCIKLDGHKLKRATKPDFLIKSADGSRAQKWLKWAFGGSDKNPFSFLYFFSWIWQYLWSSNFYQNHMSGKISFLSYEKKTSRPIRIQDSLNCNISKTSWYLSLNLYMWPPIHRINKYS